MVLTQVDKNGKQFTNGDAVTIKGIVRGGYHNEPDNRGVQVELVFEEDGEDRTYTIMVRADSIEKGS